MREYARIVAEEKSAAELAVMRGDAPAASTSSSTTGGGIQRHDHVDASKQSSKVDDLFAAFNSMPTSTSAVPL